MITVMIVDDEATIRKGISTAIDWQKFDMKIVGEAANGRDGLAKALMAKPEIVITDIKMPVMDGIHMANRIREKLPHTQIVILSGYSDFEYSRQALKAGAVDYILKPVSESELAGLMLRLRKEIEQRRSRELESDLADRLLSSNLPIIRASCIKDYMEGEISEEQFVRQAAGAVDIDLSGPRYQIVMIGIDDYHQAGLSIGDRKLLRYSVSNIAAEMFKNETNGNTAIGDSGEDQLLALLSTGASMEAVVECCRQIQFYVTQYFKVTVTIGLGEQVEDIRMLKDSYKQAQEAADNKIYQGKNRVIVAGEIPSPAQEPLFLQEQDEKELREHVKLLHNLEVQQKLNAIFTDYFGGNNIPRKLTELFCIHLIGIAFKELAALQIEPQMVFAKSVHLHEEIEKYETLEEIGLWVKSIFARTLQALERQHNNKYKNVVKKGIEYARGHYTENLQIADVAGAVFVTPNYFSKIFKQETGENFTEWLNKHRIECAKEQMAKQPEAKTYQIALQVGFNDYKYFAYIFKKYTGYSPGTYKQLFG